MIGGNPLFVSKQHVRAIEAAMNANATRRSARLCALEPTKGWRDLAVIWQQPPLVTS